MDIAKTVVMAGAAFVGAATLYTMYRRRQSPFVVTQLWTFPIKSCGGFSSSSVELTPEGVKYDREWGIFHAETHNIITQRTHPLMKLILVEIHQDRLQIKAGNRIVFVPLADDPTLPTQTLTDANIRNLDGADIRRQGAQVDKFLSTFLETPVFLGRILTKRQPIKSTLDASLVTPKETIALHDFATLTIISEEGIRFVQDGMNDPGINTNHFRPNVVVGCTTYPEEDSWAQFTIGSVSMNTARWCSRCIMPNVDDDGAFSKTRKISEFLKATRMARFPHRDEKADVKPMFGLSVFHTMKSSGTTVLKCGDTLTVHKRTATPKFL